MLANYSHWLGWFTQRVGGKKPLLLYHIKLIDVDV